MPLSSRMERRAANVPIEGDGQGTVMTHGIIDTIGDLIDEIRKSLAENDRLLWAGFKVTASIDHARHEIVLDVFLPAMSGEVAAKPEPHVHPPAARRRKPKTTDKPDTYKDEYGA